MRNPGSIISELVDERWNASHSKPRRIDAWGKNGSIKLNIDENHRHYGKVSDFERGYHGDLIGYVAFMTGKDWYGALDELAKNLNLKEGEQKNLGLTDAEKQQLKARREKNRLKVENQEKTERDTKIKRAQRIWSKSTPLEGTLAQRYLKETRGVSATLKTADIRFLANGKEVYENEQGERQISHKPALIVAARDAEGVITSIQQIYLDPNTAHKHPEAKVAKRTIGPVKGSAVLMHEGGSNEVILTEGPETGASVAQGKPEANVYTSLGNNRNYSELAHLAKKHNTDTLIFAADNDGGFGKTYQSLEAAAEQLHKAGIKVKVAMPPLLPGQEKTDFNDVLLAKGAEEVKWKIINAEAMKVENELSRDRSMSR
jgi:hypothetical protein